MSPQKEISDESTTWKSKSAKKRMSVARQKIGEALLDLAPALLKKLDLPDDLTNALLEHDKMTDKEACRRQRQYIGKIMRGVNLDKLVESLDLRRQNGEFSTPAEQKAYRELRQIVAATKEE